MEIPNEMPANDEHQVGAVARSVFRELGLKRECLGGFSGAWSASGPWIEKSSPIDGTRLGRVRSVTADECERMIADACRTFSKWREMPAPKRGEVVRCLGNALREKKSALGRLVTLEAGKISVEGEGEVQEMIDICDFAVGLSRQLHGLTIASERPGYRMMEQWHPLGPVGVIIAFNFPVAVWVWNSVLVAVCGDPTV
ncbi:MAG TPA: aldehyde dehydrogenase family protein, partial [Opitutaceae bacterium]